MTAIATLAFVLAAPNAALAQAKPKESPPADQVEQGKKGAAGPAAEQVRPEMKDKDQMSGSSISPKK
ncbi:MAG: hypothetical protein K2P86_12635 [Xanthobacteraceae bacterium]|nr:hypothetical protein [Xanthobacteraceae bacterium]